MATPRGSRSTGSVKSAARGKERVTSVTQAGRNPAAGSRSTGTARSAAAGANRNAAAAGKGKPSAKALPSQASATARERAFGAYGKTKRSVGRGKKNS